MHLPGVSNVRHTALRAAVKDQAFGNLQMEVIHGKRLQKTRDYLRESLASLVSPFLL